MEFPGFRGQVAFGAEADADVQLLRLIRASFTASYGIYGAPRVFLDLREAAETCSKHRVARLMRQANLWALHGYRTRRWSAGKPAVLIPNILPRQFLGRHHPLGVLVLT
ncbi:MAG: IS3 family transposase [Vicinamibacterales bacterium]